jgi:CheY-like chemotaxis protein
MTTGTILVVDGDPRIREVFRIARARFGFAVTDAVDNAACLAVAAQTSNDLVVLGLEPPGTEVRKVRHQLRLSSKARHLFLVGEEDETNRIAGLEQGAVCHRGTNLNDSALTVDGGLWNWRSTLAETGCGDGPEAVHRDGIGMEPCQGE